MRLVRSWPREVPDTLHPRIIDDCERVYIKAVDYRPLADLNDDVIHLDWDTAVGLDEIRAFARKCIAEPDIVRIAPTKMYHSRYWRGELPKDQSGIDHSWTTHWMAYVQMPVGRRPVETGESGVVSYSFGLVYLPRWALREFVDSLQDNENFRDGNFSEWYYRRTKTLVPVEWDVNAVHLNFSMKTALEGLDNGLDIR